MPKATVFEYSLTPMLSASLAMMDVSSESLNDERTTLNVAGFGKQAG
jgi:hypothetical protein